MEIISTSMALNAVSTDAAHAALPAATRDASAIERFSEIMQADHQGVGSQVLPTTFPLDLQNPAQASGLSLGDKILNGLSGLSTDFQQSWKNVNAVLDGGSSMNTADMLKLQMSLTQMSIQYDLVGKVVSRSTQNIEQLVKIQ